MSAKTNRSLKRDTRLASEMRAADALRRNTHRLSVVLGAIMRRLDLTDPALNMRAMSDEDLADLFVARIDEVASGKRKSRIELHGPALAPAFRAAVVAAAQEAPQAPFEVTVDLEGVEVPAAPVRRAELALWSILLALLGLAAGLAIVFGGGK